VEVVAGLSLKNWRPRVWDRSSPEFVPRLTAVMLSFDEIRRRPVLHRRAVAEGLGAVLGRDEASLRVYVDNGAFACLGRGDEPDVEGFRRFVGAVRPAWYPVPADYIPRPTDSEPRQRVLFERTLAVMRAHAGDGYCPVIHTGPWLDRYLEALRELGLDRHLAVGGLVPHLLNSPGAQRRRTIGLLRRVRREFPGRIHAFGIGGIVTLHLAAALGFDSADSSGWRHRAARGLVILRGRGERLAVKLGSWLGRPLTTADRDELRHCRCPACRARGAEALTRTGIEGFAARAVHNLTILLDEAALIDSHLAKGDFARWSPRRVAGNRMADLVTYALEVDG
jgi:7-cyano-7-deazaguanine tRNA-ribosyltransferase